MQFMTRYPDYADEREQATPYATERTSLVR
jgi:hypothetical protein